MCHSRFVFSSIFFFKQKTAYEMRISDWSSDVCSSDLIFGALPFYYGGEEVAELTLDPSFRFGLLRAAGPFSHAILAGLFFASQIGRASCRERVCQYV